MHGRLIAGGIALVVLLGLPWLVNVVRAPAPIRLGLLQSRTGSMAGSELAMIDAELLAVEELNRAGGVLGRLVEPVIADGESDGPTFAREAERLITSERVCAIVGCWTSAARKCVKTVVESRNHLLIYPLAHEGIEISENIVYTGAAPNQQIVPAVKWSLDNLGKRFFLVGSDYVGPHTVNAMVRDQLQALGGEVVGEAYVYFGSSHVAPVVQEILRTRPAVIFSSVVGDSNRAFYDALAKAGLTSAKPPVISVTIGEEELRRLAPADLTGHYAAWNYFQSIPRRENLAFVKRFRERFGAERVTSDPIHTAYLSVYLWAAAVREAGTEAVSPVRKRINGCSVNAPEGVVSVDAASHHAWRSFSVGRIRRDRQFDLVWSCPKPIRPFPYPASRSRSEWDAFLLDRYTAWGGSWVNPVHGKW